MQANWKVAYELMPGTATPVGSPEIRAQKPPVGVGIAADASGILIRKSPAGPSLRPLDRPLHLCRRRESETPAHHRRDPVPLFLHDGEQTSRGVDEPREVQPGQIGCDDAPIQGKHPPVRRGSEDDKKGTLTRYPVAQTM
jgi:hypothetical protein